MPPLVKPASRLALAVALAAVVTNLSLLIVDLDHKSYGDGPILAMIERMRHEPVSPTWFEEPPYTLCCYGPAYYYLTMTVADLGGWHNSLVPGRLVSLAATLVAAGLAALAAGRRTKSLEIGLLAALAFLVSMPVSEWVPHARVDMLAVALAAAAYVSVGPSLRSLLLSAVCVVAASLAKPTFAFSAIPIAAHLLATRRCRELGVYAFTVAALGAAVWGSIEWASDGFFLSGVLRGNRNPLQFWRGYFFLYQFLSCPLGAVAALAIGQWLIVSPRSLTQSLYGLGFLVSLPIWVVAICKQGSDVNYFLEPAFLGSIALAADIFPRLCGPDGPRRQLAVAALAAVVGLPFVREVKQQLRSPPKQPAGYSMVQRYLAGESSDVGILADGRTVDLVLAAGGRLLLNDSYLYMLLVDNGTLDFSPLGERLEDGRVKWLFLRRTVEEHKGMIELGVSCWPGVLLETVPRYYDLVETGHGVWVYRHRRYRA